MSLRHLPVVFAIFGAAIVGALAVVGPAPLGGASAKVPTQPTSGYGWPIKPFNQPHPVRGNFGDPRTIFHGPPSANTLYYAHGSYHFHRGVDIEAPVGTKVYPVRDGTVVFDTKSHVNIQSSDGTVFEYWHIGASFRLGTQVHAGKTVLGTINKSATHVDLTEVQNGYAVNPLASGHLTPYRDTTHPVLASIRLQSDNRGHAVLPNFVQGQVWLVAQAFEKPSLTVPGVWRDLPVTPALVTWRIQSTAGKVVVPTRVAADFRTNLPENGAFWSTYARGTFQNMAIFGKHSSFLQPGNYCFLLSPKTFDTRSLPDGVYNLVVTATDMRGNSSARSLRFTIHNGK
jgi:hypothetical protein